MSGKTKSMAIMVPLGTLCVIVAAVAGFGQLQGRSAAEAEAHQIAADQRDERITSLEEILVQELPLLRERLTSIETDIKWLVRSRGQEE